MAISIAWPTSVIYISRADLALIQTTPTEIRELNINSFRLALKDLEDSAEGITFLKTHTHNTEVALGGLTYARVVEILVPYTITFEDGQYAVNLVGANSNVGDRVNVNQVSVRSANSAGLTSAPAIEYSSFNGGVTVDITSSYAGTVFPIGTPQKPVNNLTDAKLIASYRGFTKFYIISSMAINTSGVYNNFIFEGESINKTKLTIYTNAEVVGCQFMNAEIEGILDGQSYIENCRIGDLAFVDGIIKNSTLLANSIIILSSIRYANFVNCVSGRLDYSDDLPPTIDMGENGTSLALRNYNGELILTNKDGLESVSIDLNSGEVILDETISNGSITIRGTGIVVDNSTGTSIVDTEGLISKSAVVSAIQDEIGEEIQYSSFNRMVCLDVDSGITGTAYPNGTHNYPVNNLSDAQAIMTMRGLEILNLHSNLTIGNGENIDDLWIKSENWSELTFEGTVSTIDTIFEKVSLYGAVSGIWNVCYNCWLNDVTNFIGWMIGGSIGTIAFAPYVFVPGDPVALGQSFFDDVVPLYPDVAGVVIMNDDTTAVFTRLRSDLELKSVEVGSFAIVDFAAGKLTVDSSCTGGYINVRGIGEVVGVTGGTIVDQSKLLSLPSIENEILDAQTSDHIIDGTVGEALGITGAGLTLQQIENSEVLAKQADLLRVLGLNQENQYMDNMTYTTYAGEQLLTGARVRIYSDGVSVGSDLNVIATYTIVASWSDNQMTSYKVTKI